MEPVTAQILKDGMKALANAIEHYADAHRHAADCHLEATLVAARQISGHEFKKVTKDDDSTSDGANVDG